jgi:hypothetical protein
MVLGTWTLTWDSPAQESTNIFLLATDWKGSMPIIVDVGIDRQLRINLRNSKTQHYQLIRLVKCPLLMS